MSLVHAENIDEINDNVDVTSNVFHNDVMNDGGISNEIASDSKQKNDNINPNTDSAMAIDTNSTNTVWTSENDNSHNVGQLGKQDKSYSSHNAENVLSTINTAGINISVLKVWDDYNNQDGVRPSQVTVELLANNILVNTTVLSQSNNWAYVFTNLPRYNGSTYLNYRVRELNISSNYTSTIRVSGNNVTITNRHYPERINLTVNKLWDDCDNNDGLRPSRAIIYVLANGNPYRNITLTRSNNWTYTFRSLPKFNNSNLINYTVEEINLTDDYTYDVTSSEYNFTVTNTHLIERIKLPVMKVWDDDDNRDNIRPANVSIQLYADGIEYDQPIILNEENNWSYVYFDLIKYNNSKLINYTVQELNVPEGYHVAYDNFNIINVHRPEKVEINVTKLWRDHANNDGIRPEYVTIQLRNDTGVVEEVILNDSNYWRYSFKNLPKYDNGVRINYTITENDIEGYTLSITESAEVNLTRQIYLYGNFYPDYETNVTTISDTDLTYTTLPVLFNDYTSAYCLDIDMDIPTGEIKYTRELLTNQTLINPYTNEDVMPYIVSFLAKHYLDYRNFTQFNDTEIAAKQLVVSAFTNYDYRNQTSDIFNQVINNTYTVSTYINETLRMANTSSLWRNNGTIKIANNGRYVYRFFLYYPEDTGSSSMIVNYQPLIGIVINFIPTNESITTKTVNLTNTHENETINVTINKIWDDNNNQDGLRPNNITVKLYTNAYITYNAVLNEFNNWSYTFTDLSKYYYGNLIDYSVNEFFDSDYYTTEIINDTYNFTIVNYHTPERINLTLIKFWNDNDNQDGLRTSNVTIQLYADGVEYASPVELREDNDWRYTYYDLFEYNNTKRINYTIRELNVPEGYVDSYDGYFVTNNHIPELININVTKVWNDSANNDGIRPDSVTIHLYNDTSLVETVILNDSNNWTYLFSNLTKYYNASLINYTIVEDSIDGYTFNTSIISEERIVYENDFSNDSYPIHPSDVYVSRDDDILPKNLPALLNDYTFAYCYNFLGKVPYEGFNYTRVLLTNQTMVNNFTNEDVLPYITTFMINHYNDLYFYDYESVHINKEQDLIWKFANYDYYNQDPFFFDKIVHDEYTFSYYVNETIDLVKNGNAVAYQGILNETALGKYVYQFYLYYPENEENDTDTYQTLIGIIIDFIPNSYYVTQQSIELINTHEIEKTELNITKVWNDSCNQDGLRPTEISVQLYANANPINTTILNAQNNWTYTFTNLTKYSNGTLINYTFDEMNIPANYTVSYNNTTIINTHIPELVNISVNKVWNDSNNQDGIRPANITVELLANGEVINTVILNVDNDWKYTFVGLAKFNKGTLVIYNISESIVPESYEVSINNCSYNFNVINTHIPEVTNLTVNKIWNDSNNQDGLRTDSIAVNLSNGTDIINTVILSESNSWTYTFDNLAKYDNGVEIIYTIEEAIIPANYTVSYDNNTIVNTHIPENTSVKVIKVWNDSNNQDGVRPSSVTVNLLADNEVIDTVVLNDANQWMHTFVNLAKYKNGVLITYSVDEVDLLVNYTKEIKNCSDSFNIINTHITENTTLSVNKIWNDSGNQDGIRPSSVTVNLLNGTAVINTVVLNEYNNWMYTFDNLPKYYEGNEIVYSVVEATVPSNYTVSYNGTEIINTHITENTTVNVSKVWNDSDNQDGIRPTSITVNLIDNNSVLDSAVLSMSNNWSYTFDNLPKFRNGEEIVYTIVEDEVPVNYTARYDGFTVINTHITENTSLNVSKIWNDSDNQDGVRPETVTVNLLNGTDVMDTVVLDESNNWSYTFENLPKYCKGVEVVYSIEEASVPTNYTVSYNGNVIINTHITENTTVSVSKVWDDSDNQDGIRPNNVTVNLLADGIIQQSIHLDESNGWKYTFENLPKFKDQGVEILYSITEDDLEGYNISINQCSNGFNVINTYIPETTELTVTKVWNDTDNQDGIRPSSVTVNLLNGTEVMDMVVLDESNNWMHTFDNLPKYCEGVEVVYSIEEASVPTNYTVSYNGNVIINTHITENTTVSVSKVWNDSDNQDAKRPNEVTINLKVGDSVIDTVILNNENNWMHTFENLPKFNEGKEIDYVVEEEDISYYSTTLVYCNGTYIFINSYVTENTSINVTKVWDDSDNQDGVRPTYITVNLLNGTEVIDTIILDESNNWMYTFDNLPKYYEGNEVVYSVEEAVVPNNYTVSYNGNEIINTHITENTTVSVSKVWNDSDNQDGVRPTSITVSLLDGTDILDSVELNSANDWMHTFINLPKFRNGEEIVYTIIEDEVPVNYTARYDGFTIINTHITENTSVSVSKVWNDSDNQDGIRSSYVSVQLYANGEPVGSPIIITALTDWKYTFNNLAKYDNGVEILYTIVETDVPNGYNVTYDDFVIYNTHVPEVINLTVKKIWDDNDNQDGIRAENISVNLYADDVLYDSTILSSLNDWEDTFINLPKYNNGILIKYTIEEMNVPDNYTVSYDNMTITNRHDPEKTSIKVIKTWNDTDNKDNIRPDNITIDLLVNNVKNTTVILSDDNNWTYTFLDLPKYQNGQLIDYTIDESETPNNYTKAVNKISSNEYEIINTHISEERIFLWAWKLIGEKIQINGTEIYNYTNNTTSFRPNKANITSKNYNNKISKYTSKNKYKDLTYRNRNNNRYKQKVRPYYMSKQRYRLYIYLYEQYLYNNMTYADFIAILQQNGITISEVNNWDENGIITIDYDDIDEVPDKITLKDTKNHVSDSEDTINKREATGASEVIDSGVVEAEIA